MAGSSVLSVASARRRFGFAFHMRQIIAIAWASFKSLATSGPGLGLLIFIPLLAIPIVLDQVVALGLPLTPTTARVVKELTGPLSAAMSRWMVIPGFIIYFAGELVWRERDNGVNEITDTMPGSEWTPVIGKFIGLCFMLGLFTTALTMAGMAAQLVMDYSHFEIALYLKIMFGLQLPEYILFTALALFVHAAVNQKYVGHLIAIIAYAFIAAVANMLGIEHNLLIFGAGPNWSYTEMRGFGSSVGPWLWFKLYWAAWALLLVVGAVLLWARGRGKRLRCSYPVGKTSPYATNLVYGRHCHNTYSLAGRIHFLQHQHPQSISRYLTGWRASRRLRTTLRTIRVYTAARNNEIKTTNRDRS